MNPSPSPRHPWKALAVVLAMFAVVHGARATVGSHEHAHEHGFTHIQINDAAADRDCPDVDVDDDDEPDVSMLIDEVDDDDWN